MDGNKLSLSIRYIAITIQKSRRKVEEKYTKKNKI